MKEFIPLTIIILMVPIVITFYVSLFIFIINKFTDTFEIIFNVFKIKRKEAKIGFDIRPYKKKSYFFSE